VENSKRKYFYMKNSREQGNFVTQLEALKASYIFQC